MNAYEERRREKIKQNQALLAELDIKPLAPQKAKEHSERKAPPAKRRKIDQGSVPSRTSARIASAPTKPSYQDEPDIKAVPLPRSAAKNGGSSKTKQELGSRMEEEKEPLVSVQDVQAIRAGWTAWEAEGVEATRDEDGNFHFEDYPDFMPNKSPAEMIREGCFGGSYYRPLRSKKLGIVIEDDWQELPSEWLAGVDVPRYLTNPTYDPEVNKFKVTCGQSI
ncbi:hypothetical protein KC336_g21123, partial [Hortaea werneckii]